MRHITSRGRSPPPGATLLGWVAIQGHFLTPSDPFLMSLRTLSLYAGLSVRSLRNHLRSLDHPLPYFRVGGKILVRQTDFDAWLVAFRADPLARVNAIVSRVLTELHAGP